MRYFPALDGLRLLASLNIVLMHLDSSWCLGTVRDWPVLGSLVMGPAFNASVFFVLGGYIYFHQLASKANAFRPWAFLKSRFFKLYPLHLLSLFLMVGAVFVRQQYYGDIWYLVKSAGAHLALLWAFDPLSWLPLNEPSWALTPFFLAYATLGLLLKPLQQETRIGALIACLLLTLLPSLVFAYEYTQVAMAPHAWDLFHVFPILRIFEFYFGMVLARLFVVYREHHSISPKAWVRDLSLLLGFIVAWLFTYLHHNFGVFWSWFGHHTLTVIVYGWIVWNLSMNQGYFVRLFSFKAVSAVGRASFYPYLLHLPLIAWTVMAAETMGFKGFFYLWWQPLAFLFVLYGVSVLHIRRKKLV